MKEIKGELYKMSIIISDEDIREIVEEEVDKSVRKRTREMQGDYTSKSYLENIMRDILWDTIVNKIPNIEEYLYKRIDEILEIEKQSIPKLSKNEIIDVIIDRLQDTE